MPAAPIVTADSITRIAEEASGAVVVNASHGGVYAAYLAARLQVAAAIFNDAGVGRDQAGRTAIGNSKPLYRACDTLLNRTLELISACPCDKGCPSCVGPTADRSERTKEVALEILARLCGDTQFVTERTAESA